jgi:hypothetical protein
MMTFATATVSLALRVAQELDRLSPVLLPVFILSIQEAVGGLDVGGLNSLEIYLRRKSDLGVVHCSSGKLSASYLSDA